MPPSGSSFHCLLQDAPAQPVRYLKHGRYFVLKVLAFVQHGFSKTDQATDVFDDSHDATHLWATYSVCLHSLVMQF